jgi:hypothetical protein
MRFLGKSAQKITDILELLQTDKKILFDTIFLLFNSSMEQPISVYNTVEGYPTFKSALDNLPTRTAEYLKKNKEELYNSLGTKHIIQNKGKDITAIVFNYGILYTGREDGLIFKGNKWKVIWFEQIKEIDAGLDADMNDKSMTIKTTTEKAYEFKPSVPSLWDKFRCDVYTALTLCPVKQSDLDNRIVCRRRGGRRKTKRNKKCKRRTRRS